MTIPFSWLFAALLALWAAPAQAGAVRPVHLEQAKGRVLEAPQRVVRISVTDPAIADVTLFSKTGLLVTGKKRGATSLIVWTEGGERLEYDVSVSLDTRDLERALRRAVRSDDVHATYSQKRLILTGTVSHPWLARQAGRIAEGFSDAPIVNLVDVAAPPQVQVDVQVVELVRSTGQDTGVAWGALRQKAGGEAVFLKDLLTFSEAAEGPPGGRNILTFGQFDRLAAELRLLVSEGRARVLAEPRLVVVSGATASVLVGGEFPVPVSQQLGHVAVSWRGYGVKLDIAPQLAPDGRIDLHVRPEVSALDFSNAIRVGGYTLPSLRSRLAETQVVLGPGEGLGIGGLTQRVETETVEKLPLLGDIPILGALFSTTRRSSETTELAILVTPKLVAAQAPGGAP